MSSGSSLLNLAQRAQLYAQLAAMERAGLPPDQAFALLKLPTPAARAAVVQLLAKLRSGSPIADAGLQVGLWDVLEHAVLRAAIAAGSPERTYQTLSAQLAARARRRAAMRARLLLPLFLVLAIGLIQPLPALFAGQIGALDYLWLALRPLLLIGLLVVLLTGLPRRFSAAAPSPSRAAVERLLLRTPLFGPMLVRRDALRFWDNLALLLEAGVAMFEALPLALSTVQLRVVRADFARLLPSMEAGLSLTAATAGLEYSGPPQTRGMVATGEDSGTLPAMLQHHSRLEAAQIQSFDEQVAIWLPRLLYALVALWMAWSLLSGAGRVASV